MTAFRRVDARPRAVCRAAGAALQAGAHGARIIGASTFVGGAIEQAYPVLADGGVQLPSPRLFIVATQ